MLFMWEFIALNSVWALVPVALIAMAIRPVSYPELRSFAGRYSIEVTQETLPFVTRSVRRGRVGRLVGTALGLSLYPVLYGVGISIPNASVVYAVIGYLFGAFVTALIPASQGVGLRGASLVPRSATDYLPRIALISPIAAFAVSAIAIVVYELEPHRVLPSVSGSPAGPVISGIAAAATLIAVKVVVARAQPVTTPGLVALDDGLRTQALHTIAGSGIAVALIGTASSLFQMGGHASATWLTVVGIVLGICALMGVVSAWGFRMSAWRVSRPIPG
jgi:hypothetical protein